MNVSAVVVCQTGAVSVVNVCTVPIVWSRLRVGSWLGSATGPDSDVRDHVQIQLSSRAPTVRLALAVLHPVEITVIPVAEHNDHLRHIVSHVPESLATVSLLHHDLIAILGDGPLVAQEVVIPLLELQLNVEWELGVDPVLAAIAISGLAVEAHVGGVERALAASVASGVDAILRGIAFVGS